MAKRLNGKETAGRISFQLNQTNHNQKHYQRDHYPLRDQKQTHKQTNKKLINLQGVTKAGGSLF
jgi:hypothetical protein